jgi:diacylglycerol kinase
MEKFLRSFVYAFKGIKVAIREQLNLKIQLTVAIIIVLLGFYFQLANVEWAIILLSIGLVLSLELVNTSIENIVDLMTTDRNVLAGKIKDVAAGAVLIAAIIAIIIGCLIFAPYLVAA